MQPSFKHPKSLFLGHLLRKINLIRSTTSEVSVKQSVTDLVNTFNALALPKGYVYICPDDMIHVVMINNSLNSTSLQESIPLAYKLGSQVSHEADIIWDFEPMTGLWRTLKDRTGILSSLCPMKFGGFRSEGSKQAQK